MPKPSSDQTRNPSLRVIRAADCPIDWMRAQLPAGAISIADRLPDLRDEVIGWLSDPDVCIYFTPAVVWRTPTFEGKPDEWWAGLPGQYIDLKRHRWRLSHWMPLPGESA